MDPNELYVVIEGPPEAVPLVLVHGAPDRSAAFRQACGHLDASVRVVRYDRRGYGRSVGATPARSMADHADDLLGVIGAVGGRAVVVAHSFGSNPAMLAAVARPAAFAALGVWEPPMVWLEWWPRTTKDYDAEVAAAPDPAQMAEEFNRRVLGDDAWEALSPEKQALRRAEGPAFARDMASLATAPFAADRLTVPTVVGHGSDTSPEHVEGARRLAAQVADGRLVTIEGAGHFANQTHPEEFAAFITATVDRAAER
ncbi:MAG: alpha/beta hydrolase [Acidimicrobiales bacterium]|nr:alpha/beta hydrolase [Acidimicrobiales bacterium]